MGLPAPGSVGDNPPAMKPLLLVMAIIGGAICTPLMGYIAEKTDSMAIAMTVPLAAYLYVAWYSFAGTGNGK